jgi:hypothetical protein
MTPIKYIGKRETYREGAYGTGIVFAHGQTVNIEDDELARKMLRHKDVYVRGDAKAAVETTTSKAKDAAQAEEDPVQDTRDAIATMNKDALESFTKTHFGVDLDKRKSVSSLRDAVTHLIDRFGAP